MNYQQWNGVKQFTINKKIYNKQKNMIYNVLYTH